MFENTLIRVLLIEDEEFDVRRVMRTLQPFQNRIVVPDVVANGAAALELLRTATEPYDVVVMDFQIAGGLMGEHLIRAIKSVDPSLQIIVITKMTVNITDFDFASRLLSAGAFWYCTKYPGDIEEYIYQPTDFVLSIYNAYQKRRLEQDRRHANHRLARTAESMLEKTRILGSSPAILDVIHQVEKCAASNASVLISGSSGTGKEIVAQNIHYLSDRRLETFVPINCGSIPDELVESELFGYEKGAFTGATARKLGLFEMANNGTLFLDEIGELPLSTQVKLLRVLQGGEIEKIGRTGKIRVDVRIIAATNKDLEKEVEAGRFREDLFYRLNVVRIALPSLRDRRDDIPFFVNHFLEVFCAEAGVPAPTVEPDALRLLREHDWPGNVRELMNVLRRLLFDNDQIIAASAVAIAFGRLPGGGGAGDAFGVRLGGRDDVVPWRQMERMMREKYFRFVRLRSSSDADAAKKLGLAPPNYHRMCKELGIK
jgi:two-component system response regulator AtoC